MRRIFPFLWIALLAGWAPAEVFRLQVTSREVLLEGKEFGSAGPYEKLSGKVIFFMDPENEHNARIVDLGLAPRNQSGFVEARADFMVLKPVNPEKGSGTALLEVSNRGRKASLSYFNAGSRSLDPASSKDLGDGFLMRRGLTVIWVGWQWDVPEDDGLLRLEVPVARGEAGDITGLVRSDWTVDGPTTTLALGHRRHRAYPVLDPKGKENYLTVRDGRLAERVEVSRRQWQFAREENGEVVADPTHIYMAKGFEPGKIYELVYKSQQPAIVGLGLAAVRDMMSYAKYDSDCPFPVDRGMAVGISQTGRFLRHFLYQGFNTDEKGRKSFDGLLIHTAGAGRGSFNHRFGQPSRDAHRYSAFFFPTDLFPFTGMVQKDAETGCSDGLLRRHLLEGNLPKVFYTNTGYEYWGRAASLLHTTLDGKKDLNPLPQERIYHLASTQHFPYPFPPPMGIPSPGAPYFKGNPVDFLVTQRALLAALQEWVEGEQAPPPSIYPRIDEGTLVSIDKVKWPEIPGLEFPRVIHEAYRVDYGSRWEQGIIDKQPPVLGKAFPSLVSQVDSFGNEVGGVPTVDIIVPLATFLPWHLRKGIQGGVGELTDFFGTFYPLPRTAKRAAETEDPRPNIESLYPSREDYLNRVKAAARLLVEDRYLLSEDVGRVLRRSQEYWDWIQKK